MNTYIAPRQKILRHPEALAVIRRGEIPWPLNVEMDLSNRCNLVCSWCPFAHLHDGVIMAEALIRRTLDQLWAGGTRAVTFSGGGEPTCHPFFSFAVDYAHSLGFKVGLYTNGTHPDPITRVLDLFTWVYVSLDAANPEDWAKIKHHGAVGHSLFWTVLDTVGSLLAGREGGCPTVGLGFLLSADNWEEAGEMAALADGLGVDYCQFRPVVDRSADYGWVAEALPVLDRLAGEKVVVSRERFADLLSQRPRGYSLCRGSALVPCIGADGTVWVCPNTRGLRGLGDLKVSSFATIWHSRPQQRVGPDCRVECRNHALNETLELVCQEGPHDAFV